MSVSGRLAAFAVSPALLLIGVRLATGAMAFTPIRSAATSWARLRIVEFHPALNFEPQPALFFAQPRLSEALQEALHQLGRLVRDVRPDPCQRQLGLLVSQRGQKQPSLVNSPGIG